MSLSARLHLVESTIISAMVGLMAGGGALLAILTLTLRYGIWLSSLISTSCALVMMVCCWYRLKKRAYLVRVSENGTITLLADLGQPISDNMLEVADDSAAMVAAESVIWSDLCILRLYSESSGTFIEIPLLRLQLSASEWRSVARLMQWWLRSGVAAENGAQNVAATVSQILRLNIRQRLQKFLQNYTQLVTLR